MTELSMLVERYAAMWNEPDPRSRRAAIEALWAKDGVHLTPDRRAEGWDQIDARVSEAYRQWVEPGTFVFRSAGNISGHNGTVKFNWEMVPAAGGEPAAGGLDFLVLDPQGHITADYQTVER